MFVGGCDLEAAEAVCDPDGRLGLDVLESISSLIENSLLVEQDDPRGEPRYSMLETIREYASEKLEASGETDALRRRHAEYFLALAERGKRMSTSSPGPSGGANHDWERDLARQTSPRSECSASFRI